MRMQLLTILFSWGSLAILLLASLTAAPSLAQSPIPRANIPRANIPHWQPAPYRPYVATPYYSPPRYSYRYFHDYNARGQGVGFSSYQFSGGGPYQSQPIVPACGYFGAPSYGNYAAPAAWGNNFWFSW
jgi:hypothetical protein